MSIRHFSMSCLFSNKSHPRYISRPQEQALASAHTFNANLTSTALVCAAVRNATHPVHRCRGCLMCAMLKLRSGGRRTTRIQTDRSGIARCVSSFVRTRIEERCRAPAHRGAVERLVGVFVLVTPPWAGGRILRTEALVQNFRRGVFVGGGW